MSGALGMIGRSDRGSNRLSVILTVCAVVSVVSACGITEKISESTRVDYKGAGKLPSLEVPPDLITPKGDERFFVPDRPTQSGEKTYSSYQAQQAQQAGRGGERAAPAGVEAQVGGGRVQPVREGVRLERAGGQRWLVVRQPADRVWAIVREFWVEQGFPIASEEMSAGILETEYVENRARIPKDFLHDTLGSLLNAFTATGDRDSFRTRLERTADSEGTEIYIAHHGMTEVESPRGGSPIMAGEFRWRGRPNDPELEAEFLQRLSVKLSGDVETGKKVARELEQKPVAATTGKRTSMPAGALEEGIAFSDGFDRVWRRVGLALDRGGFTVEDRDRSQGVYFVRYIDPESTAEKPGFFARLFSRDSGKSSEGAQQFRIRVSTEGTGARVTVLAKDGQILARDADRLTGSRILTLLRDRLVDPSPAQ